MQRMERSGAFRPFRRWMAGMLLAAVLGAGLSAGNALDAAPSRGERLLVRYRAGVATSASAALMAAARARVVRRLAQAGVDLVELPPGASAPLVAAALARQPIVAFAEVDRRVAHAAVPNDPRYRSQWHLPRIDAPAAWDITTGHPAEIIAIIDTGVDPQHPDLVAKLVPGWNFYDDNADTRDVTGHGTAVAGTAAASSGNATGVAAPAWNCRIMPLRVSDSSGYAWVSTIADALIWAADRGVRIANISYGVSNSPTVSSAAAYFAAKGGIVTVSAGNEGRAEVVTDDPNIVTVSATDSADRLASWSNTGDGVDLAAPGVSILTTTVGGDYGVWSGTSFAAPIVAGVAALVRSVNPALSPDEVVDILERSADDLGAEGWDPSYGAGRVNAARAVAIASGDPSGGEQPGPSVRILAPKDGSRARGAVRVRVETTSSPRVVRVELYVDGRLAATSTRRPFKTVWRAGKEAPGPHTLQCRAWDEKGRVAESQRITVYR